MAAAAITAPKSGGQRFLAVKANFLETVVVEDTTARKPARCRLPMRCFESRLIRSRARSVFQG